MRTTIQGKEITVILKADRELTTHEIISAHQLSTGNFEALFVNDDSNSHLEDETHEQKEGNLNKHKDDWIEKGERVQVEIMCPYCGHSAKAETRWGNSFCKCPNCYEKLFNKYATDKVGEKNSWGCVYVADEPMKFKTKLEEDEKLFLGEDIIIY